MATKTGRLEGARTDQEVPEVGISVAEHELIWLGLTQRS